MTRVNDDGSIIIEDEPPQQCDDCGQMRELRPYGPNDTCICIECANKDPEGTARRMMWKLHGIPPTDPHVDLFIQFLKGFSSD